MLGIAKKIKMKKHKYLFCFALLFSTVACETAQKNENSKKEEILKVAKLTPETFSKSEVPNDIKQLYSFKSGFCKKF